MPPSVQLPARYRGELTLLGAGGFGHVYRATDHQTGAPVAIKVPYRAGSAGLAQDVLIELRAGAVLRHPGVVAVLDADLDPSGVPFLVLEYADAGTLARVLPEQGTDWQSVAPLFAQILDALGHAHARGLVHRDIKPDNILLQRAPDGSLRTKITDFGLAKVRALVGGDASTRMGAGTLLFMPPESFDTRQAIVHPGIDLYAFGVMIYRAISGRSPWGVDDLSVVTAKLHGHHIPLSELRDRALPQGLAGVVDRLLDRDPARRQATAAQVRHELFPERAAARGAPRRNDTGSSTSRLGPGRIVLPDHPPADEAPIGPPPGAAVALVREPILVGRGDLREALWRIAARACAEPMGVVLTGSPGVGRSRLVHWLACVLEEQTGVQALRVVVPPEGGPWDGVAGAVRRLLALGRTEGAELEAKVHNWLLARGIEDGRAGLDAAEWRAWLEGTAATTAVFVDPQELEACRLALLDRLQLAAGTGGLFVLTWEQRGGVRGAQIAGAVLRAARSVPFPLLMFWDGGTEGIPTGPGWETLVIPPLDDAHIDGILGDLGVGEDRPRLIGAAQGLPRRAVEAARWLASSRRAALLEQAADPPSGIGLDDATLVPVSHRPGVPRLEVTSLAPDRVARVRLESFVLAPSAPSDQERRMALVALLAALPRPCAGRWLDSGLACGSPGTEGRVLDAARLAGILVRDDAGDIDFAGGALAGAAADLLQERGDAAGIRSHAAALLLSEAVPTLPMLRHAASLLRSANQPHEALPILLRVAHAEQDPDAALRAWEEAVGVATVAAVLPPDPRVPALRLGAARAARNVGDVQRAEVHLAALGGIPLSDGDRGLAAEITASLRLLAADLAGGLQAAREAVVALAAAGDRLGGVRAALLEADALSRARRLTEAVPAFERTLEHARAEGAVREEAWARWLLARTLRLLGDRGRARVELEAALTFARAHGVPAVLGGALRELGNLALLDRRTDDAEVFLRESIEVFECAGLKIGVAVTRISLGEAARFRGALDLARKEYAAALTITRAYSLTGESLAALVNLGIVEIALDRGPNARRRLLEIDELLAPGTGSRLRPHIEALRFAVLVSGARWEDAEALLTRLQEDEIPADPDVLWLLEWSADRAAAAGETVLAGDAWGFALSRVRAAGDSEGARRISERMAGGRGP